MAALDTVQAYVAAARVLLNDTVEDYRYPDADLVQALSFAILEARRIRPDLFLDRFDDLPFFTANDTTAVDIDPQYRPPFVLYMVGYAQLRDEEDTQDTRAAALINMFKTQLVSIG